MPAPTPFLGRHPQDWSAEMATVLTPAFTLVRSAVPRLRQVASGRIVLLGAGWTLMGVAGTSVGAAAHGAVVAMVKTLARDPGPDGTTVNEVVWDAAATPHPDALARAVG